MFTLDDAQDIYDAAVQFKSDGKSSFKEYVEEDKFLVKPRFKNKIVFGYDHDVEDGVYNIITMELEQETIGKNDPKLEVTKNKHVKVEFYKSEFPEFDSSMTPSEVTNLFQENSEEMTFVKRGWLHGYRLEDFHKTLEDLFDLTSGYIQRQVH